jgi:hypothetical protein
MAEEPEEGFTVRDRRRVSLEAEEAPADSPPARSDRGGRPLEEAVAAGAPQSMFAAAGADAAGELETDFESDSVEENALPDIYSVLMLFLGEMRSHAWLRMGLVANPVTGMIERDLTQAVVAIDTAVFLAGQIEGVLPPEERLPLRAMISDLQINFVEQSKRG